VISRRVSVKLHEGRPARGIRGLIHASRWLVGRAAAVCKPIRNTQRCHTRRDCTVEYPQRHHCRQGYFSKEANKSCDFRELLQQCTFLYHEMSWPKRHHGTLAAFVGCVALDVFWFIAQAAQGRESVQSVFQPSQRLLGILRWICRVHCSGGTMLARLQFKPHTSQPLLVFHQWRLCGWCCFSIGRDVCSLLGLA
jgi:hypothetical protein